MTAPASASARLQTTGVDIPPPPPETVPLPPSPHPVPPPESPVETPPEIIEPPQTGSHVPVQDPPRRGRGGNGGISVQTLA